MSLNTSIKLENFIVNKAPAKAFYIPNFINEEEEKIILKKLYEAPKPKWVQLSNRRLQNWGGFPHSKGMVAETIPSWLKTYMQRIDALNLLDGNNTNHVLVNEYLSGQGIMPHVDGPIFYPTITTINLGSHTVLDIYRPFDSENSDITNIEENDSSTQSTLNGRKIGSLMLERRSLLVLQEDLYTKYLHGIAEKSTDVIDDSIFNVDEISYSLGDILNRETRVSLTIRYFPKVLKFKLGKI
ncbi:UNVERIFIED_CONTAM: hypothetical protein RMT77_008460 [Armadillidium vulgare]